MPKFLKFCPYSDCGKECTPLESLVTLQIHNILSWDKDKNCNLRCDHQDTLIPQNNWNNIAVRNHKICKSALFQVHK